MSTTILNFKKVEVVAASREEAVAQVENAYFHVNGVNIINISWWWCFCPIWLPFAIGAVLIVSIILLAILYSIVDLLL
jgi:hypothetical protein